MPLAVSKKILKGSRNNNRKQALLKKAATKHTVHLLFILGLLAPMVLLLSYLAVPSLAIVWLITFVAWHFLGVFVAIMILKKLLFK